MWTFVQCCVFESLYAVHSPWFIFHIFFWAHILKSDFERHKHWKYMYSTALQNQSFLHWTGLKISGKVDNSRALLCLMAQHPWRGNSYSIWLFPIEKSLPQFSTHLCMLHKYTFSAFRSKILIKPQWLIIENMLHKGNYIIDTGTVLGNGSFGTVHPATHQGKTQNVAAKRIERKSEMDAHEVATDLLKLVDLDHPNIARVFDIAQDRKSVWMFLEYCEHKDLQKYFDRPNIEGKKVSNNEKVKLMLDIAKGVDYLHKRNVIHRDIKPSNILLAGSPVSAKLTDFDFSKFLGIDESTMSTKVGTEAFKAPEFFFRTDDGKLKYKRSVDIFAVGLTFLAMIQENEGLLPKVETPNEPSELFLSSGRLLYERITYKIQPQSVADASRGNRLEREIRSLIVKMTSAEPTDRLHADQVVETLLDIHNAEAKKAATLKVVYKNLAIILCYVYTLGPFSFLQIIVLFVLSANISPFQIVIVFVMVKNCCAKVTSIEFCLFTGHSELWLGVQQNQHYNCNLNSLCCVCGLMICWPDDFCHLSPGCKLAGLKNCNGINTSTQYFQWSWGFMT